MTEPDAGAAAPPDMDDLPQSDLVGKDGVWTLPPPQAHDADALVVRGRFLGVGSSEHSTHNHADEYGARGAKCGACRWFETRIFRLDDGDGGGYLLYHVGASIVPGEEDRVTVQRARNAYEVIELYTRRTEDRVYLTNSAALALAQGAGFDEGLRDAYGSRVVL